MDKSILPGMTKKSFGWSFGGKKKAKKRARTQPGAVDDDAMARVRKRREQLKKASDDL